MTDHAELRKLAGEATKGEWFADCADEVTVVLPDQAVVSIALINPMAELLHAQQEANARYIAAAHPQAILDLLDEIEALRLAILGGEDAPGLAASLTLAEVLQAHRDNQSFAASTADALRAENTRLAGIVGEAREALSDAVAALKDIHDSCLRDWEDLSAQVKGCWAVAGDAYDVAAARLKSTEPTKEGM